MTSWRPSAGILTAAEIGRALEGRPGWHWNQRGLVRELQFRDFASARRIAGRLADEATYYGRHPEMTVHDDGRLVVLLASPNHSGVTVADLVLADKVDRVVV